MFEYCEQLSAFGFKQPLNVYSNLAYMAVGYLFWRQGFPRRLTLMCFIIGINSAIWHGVMMPWALALDIATVTATLLLILFDITKNMQSMRGRLGAILGFAVICILCGLAGPATWLYTSAFFPVIMLLAVLAFLKRDGRLKLAGAAAFLSIAAVARIIDMPLCQVFPYGTHFIWHLGSACALYLALSALVKTSSLSHRVT